MPELPSSPIAALGHITLWVAYVLAGYAVAAGIVGNAQHRRRLVNSSVYALYAFFGVMLVASALIVYAFVTHDYTIKYVARYSDTSMSIWYKITAYWGGLDGSLMFWVFVLASFAAVAVRANCKRHRDMIGYVVAVIMVVQLFFLSILIYAKNPFATYLTPPPVDGEGLNPLLQNYWMVIHPPSLYTGFVAATIPFAFGIAALASGRLDDQWLRSVRSWTLICWFFLSLGLILGGRWAYEELGWGGYWAWDPVENAGLLPWFTATAFLHSIMIQEQRGMMKTWNLVLVILTFWLTIFGTFMTRSGVVQSVHAFGEDNQLALLFILFMAFIFVVSFGLLVWRSNRLRSSNSFESFASREFAFLLNNWILLACAVFVLFATMFPTISEAIDGERITVGPEFFNKWMTPLGLVLLFLAGFAPLLAWRRTTGHRLQQQFLVPGALAVLTIAALVAFLPVTRVRTSIFHEAVELPVSLINFGLVAFVFACVGQEFAKGLKVRMRQTGSDPVTSLIGLILSKRRKYGGYVIHLAVAVMFFGFAGKAYETMKDVTVQLQNPAETFEVREYRFTYEDLIVEADDNKRSVTAEVGLYEGSERMATMRPAKWDFVKGDQPTTEVDIHETLAEDIYIVLTGYDESNGVANFRIYINPLINWVWIGFGLLILGTAICLFPQKWVDNLSPRRRTRAGRAGEVAVIFLVVGAATFGMTQLARAQAPPVEHADVTDPGRQGHNTGAGYAHECRPEESSHPSLAKKLMQELICQCGGCKRENLYVCRCGYAAQERCEVLAMVERVGGDDDAYEQVIDAFVEEYGGEHVLATPRNKLSWLIPYVAIAGGLVVFFLVGRRWVRRGRMEVPVSGRSDDLPDEDEDYADILDDELRDTD